MGLLSETIDHFKNALPHIRILRRLITDCLRNHRSALARFRFLILAARKFLRFDICFLGSRLQFLLQHCLRKKTCVASCMHHSHLIAVKAPAWRPKSSPETIKRAGNKHYCPNKQLGGLAPAQALLSAAFIAAMGADIVHNPLTL